MSAFDSSEETRELFPEPGPSGAPETVFLVLTDVVDSTRLAAELGEAKNGAVWDAHDHASRGLLERWDGREVERTDGMLALFKGREAAVAFALGYLEALGTLQPPLSARVGVHCGPLVVRANPAEHVRRGAKALEADGLALSVTARVSALARGGQVLLTEAALGPHIDAVSQGHWHLKGAPEPVELFALAAPEAEIPDGDKAYRVVKDGEHWVPVHAIPKTLPAEWDGFFGRDEDLQAIRKHFGEASRLVTLAGIGGVGKTRLACRYAWSSLAEFPGGSWFCDLSECRTQADIERTVAVALGVPIDARDATEQIGHAMAGRGHCLVLLDNFEQLVAHADATLTRWLTLAPQAHFLVTSRERLGVPGEALIGLEFLAEAEAVRLFRARAEAAKPGFSETHSPEDEDLRALVRRLDQLPLAIELAAPRVRVMSLPQLLHRLEARLELLSSSERRDTRSANLRANLDWSWELLDEEGRRGLAQLSVFEGGFTLGAAEAVLGGSQGFDVVQTLVDRSLVRRVDEDRFDLLSLVREYADQRLDELDRVEIERRHGSYYAQLEGPPGSPEVARELDNIVAACLRAVYRADSETALQTLKMAWAVVDRQGPFSLAARLANEVGELPGLQPGLRDRLRAEALLASGSYLEGQRELQQCLRRLGFPEPKSFPGLIFRILSRVGRQFWRRLVQPRLRPSISVDVLMAATRAYQRLVETYWFSNRPERMLGAALSALDLSEPAGASPELARAYATVALAASGLRFDDTADRYAALALASAERTGAPEAEAYVRFLACVYRIGHGRFDEVDADLELVIPLFEKVENNRLLGDARAVRGMSYLYRGRFEEAEAEFAAVIRAGQRLGNDQHEVWGRLGRCEACLRMEDPESARSEADAALVLLERFRSAPEIARARGLLARTELALGRRDVALGTARQALRELEQLGPPTAHYLLEGYASVVEVELALGGSARSSRRRLRAFAKAFPIGEPRWAQLEAESLRRRGRSVRADERAEESVAAAKALGMVLFPAAG